MNLVLCHGILGFRTFLGVNYFNGVKAHIEAKYAAVKILVTQVDPVAAVGERGEQLRGQILEALGDTGMPPTLAPGDKTHIVAHSMGGLDARYVLSPANQSNIGGRVTSLTTISTPHRGSPVADLLMAEAQGALGLSDRVAAASMRHSMTLLGIPLAGLHDLTTAATAAFNAQYTDNPGVQYLRLREKEEAESCRPRRFCWRPIFTSRTRRPGRPTTAWWRSARRPGVRDRLTSGRRITLTRSGTTSMSCPSGLHGILTTWRSMTASWSGC